MHKTQGPPNARAARQASICTLIIIGGGGVIIVAKIVMAGNINQAAEAYLACTARQARIRIIGEAIAVYSALPGCMLHMLGEAIVMAATEVIILFADRRHVPHAPRVCTQVRPT